MIRSLELENVRNFEGSGWTFPLLPLSVFCGANSAGKSTIFKALLLFLQSQSSSSGPRFDGRLQFVGTYADLGDYTSFVSHRDPARDLGLAILISGWMPKPTFVKLQKLRNAQHLPVAVPTRREDPVEYQLHSSFWSY